MTWMLCEEVLKSLVGLATVLSIKAIARVAMGVTLDGELRRCMVTGCGAVAARRGMCPRCYGRAKAKVEAGETTWEKLVERGLCEDIKDPFDSAYDRAMEDN